jgi:hypothetical protein
MGSCAAGAAREGVGVWRGRPTRIHRQRSSAAGSADRAGEYISAQVRACARTLCLAGLVRFSTVLPLADSNSKCSMSI